MDCWIGRLGDEAPREGTRRAGRQKAEMREGRVWLVFGGRGKVHGVGVVGFIVVVRFGFGFVS